MVSKFLTADGSSLENEASYENELKQTSTRRIFHLLQLLLANECTREDIFEQLSSYYKVDGTHANSRSANKMFERDMKFLRNEGFEIKSERRGSQPTRYSIMKGSGPGTTFLFTQQEVDNLALLYNIFADPTRYTQIDATQPLPQSTARNPFAEGMLSLIEKLAAGLPAEQRKQFDRWVRKPYVYFNLSTVADYLPHRPTVDIIVRAISRRQQIQFEYTPTRGKQDKIFHEHIDPYYIIYMEGHFYLIAYNHKTSAFLEYRIDRIQQETLKIQPNMIDVQRRRRPIEFRFWIDGDIAKRGLSRRWLTQTLEREEVFIDENGRQRRRVLVRATAYNEWRIRQQMLKYGDTAELVEPPELRERMRQTVEGMRKAYER